MTVVRCPTCQQSFNVEKTPVMPFCSLRCQQIDMGRWLDERHGLPLEREEGTFENDSPLGD